jgi:hypothetical protein
VISTAALIHQDEATHYQSGRASGSACLLTIRALPTSCIATHGAPNGALSLVHRGVLELIDAPAVSEPLAQDLRSPADS